MFKLNIKLIVAVLIMLVVAGGVLYAGPNFIYSPQREATASLFLSDADVFMNPRNYTALNFNRWFGLISFFGNHGDFGNNSMAQIGFATRFGNLYTAFFYGGNAFRIAPNSYTEKEDPFFGRTIKSYVTEPGSQFGSFRPRNEFAVLVGVADMGFRFSFVSTYQIRNLNENIVIGDEFGIGGLDYYKAFRNEFGRLNPEFAWGMTSDLTAIGIRPHLYVNMDFFRDYQRFEKYTGPDLSDGTDGDVIGRSNNNISLDLTAALGRLRLVRNEAFEFGLDLWYTLGLKVFDNEFNYFDGDRNRIGKIMGNYDPDNGIFEERSEISHVITPKIYTIIPRDKISFSAEFGLTVGYSNVISTGMAIKTDDTSGLLVRDGEDTNTTSLSFAPVLNFGMIWEIVPERFFINAGSHISFGNLILGTTETANFIQGERDPDNPDTKIINNTFEGARTELSLGITFNPSSNLSLQAMSGVETDGNIINVFDGLTTFSKLLVTMKF
jgi:hypothetical protein